MTDRPILFSAPMVRAILDGRKTQTRRVLKPQPPEWATFCQELEGLYVTRGWAPSGLWQWCEPEQSPPRKLRRWPVHEKGPMAGDDYGMSPPYAAGDRLWVRETWTHTGDGVWTVENARMALSGAVRYRADGPIAGAKYWPSIHMPREFSRITLEVTGVKVERLQDISAADSVAEGVECETCAAMQASACGGNGCFASLSSFRYLWNSINDKRPGCSWEANPWVVAIAFKRVTP